MQQQSAEFNVTKTYLEWLADLPWSKTTPDRIEVADVRRCLDEDHFGLEKVKKRIVEYVAIRKLRKDKKGPILCFIGPPGVGKTSLGRSIARSMGRRYGRIALGGVRDEAEIRGHRRTYVGALPGRIMQALKKAGTKNPVLVLDEIDKMGIDMRGDPAAALLEVLDPEQNVTFQDHYIDCPFDVSQITFLATANNYDTIPPALLDRMEVIDVSGYTRNEKLNIAREFLVPKQLSEHGITDERLEFAEPGISSLIDHYTREAGVRNLEREIASMCRHVAVRLAEGEDVHEVVVPELVEKVLGPHKSRPKSPSARASLASPPASRGLRRGARSSSSRPRKCPVRGTPLHREHAQRDARVGVDRRLVRPLARRSPHASARVAQADRSSRAHPAGGNPQRRPQRRGDGVRGGRLVVARLSGQTRCRDDRRDHAAG